MFPAFLRFFRTCAQIFNGFEKFERDPDGARGPRGAFGLFAAAVADDALEMRARAGKPRDKGLYCLRIGIIEEASDRRIFKKMLQIRSARSGGSFAVRTGFTGRVFVIHRLRFYTPVRPFIKDYPNYQ